MVVLEEAGQYPILDHVVMNVSDFSFLWKGWRKGFIYLFFDCLCLFLSLFPILIFARFLPVMCFLCSGV